MPISLSAKKSLRKSNKNYRVNSAIKEKLKKVIKGFLAKPSEAGLKKVFSALDKAKSEGLVHRNKVARLKSQYSRKITVDKAKKTVKDKMSK